MNNKLFQKAKKNLKYLTYQGTTELTDHFNFHFSNDKEQTEEDISVILSNDIGISFKCTCMHHSCKDPNQTKLCSYVLAALAFKVMK